MNPYLQSTNFQLNNLVLFSVVIIIHMESSSYTLWKFTNNKPSNSTFPIVFMETGGSMKTLLVIWTEMDRWKLPDISGLNKEKRYVTATLVSLTPMTLTKIPINLISWNSTSSRDSKNYQTDYNIPEPILKKLYSQKICG